MYIKPNKKGGEKGRVIVPYLNNMNALTLLSSNYQRTLESVNCPGSSFLYDSPNVSTVGIQFADGVRLSGGIMISHCRVFQSVSVFSRQYLVKSEGEIGSGSPEKEQTRHDVIFCTGVLSSVCNQVLMRSSSHDVSSGVCIETKTAKNKWINAYISDILFTALILHDNRMNVWDCVFFAYLFLEWMKWEKNVLGWINYRPNSFKKKMTWRQSHNKKQ